MARIFIDILIFIAIIHGWWLVILPLVLVGAWRYGYFFEVVIAGLAYDSLFGLAPGMGILGYAGLISSMIIFLGMMAFKKIYRR